MPKLAKNNDSKLKICYAKLLLRDSTRAQKSLLTFGINMKTLPSNEAEVDNLIHFQQN